MVRHFTHLTFFLGTFLCLVTPGLAAFVQSDEVDSDVDPNLKVKWPVIPWRNALIPYDQESMMRLDDDVYYPLLEELSAWAHQSCVRFRPRRHDDTEYVYFANSPNGCASRGSGAPANHRGIRVVELNSDVCNALPDDFKNDQPNNYSRIISELVGLEKFGDTPSANRRLSLKLYACSDAYFQALPWLVTEVYGMPRTPDQFDFSKYTIRHDRMQVSRALEAGYDGFVLHQHCEGKGPWKSATDNWSQRLPLNIDASGPDRPHTIVIDRCRKDKSRVIQNYQIRFCRAGENDPWKCEPCANVRNLKYGQNLGIDKSIEVDDKMPWICSIG